MKNRFILSVLLSCIFIYGTVAFALTYRCGGKLIKKGDTKVSLIENCGKPDMLLSIVSINRGAMVKQQVLVYEQGSKKSVSRSPAGRFSESANMPTIVSGAKGG
jgi:hypothetical protein